VRPNGTTQSALGRATVVDLAANIPPESALAERARRVLATLPIRQHQVLRLRYGIGESAEMSTAEIGRRFALTQARIRQIEANALRTLRHPSRRRRLRLWIEG